LFDIYITEYIRIDPKIDLKNNKLRIDNKIIKKNFEFQTSFLIKILCFTSHTISRTNFHMN
jgi:hypothetical protein